MEIIRDLWLCVDCTIVACNGDYSGIDDETRIAEINAGFDRLGEHVSANFDLESDDDEKRGHREFSSCGCDCCGSHLAGEFHRFASFGEELTGYVECACCSETIMGRAGDLCDCCKNAGCEVNRNNEYDECQIPQCEHCNTRATFCTDQRWHSNCEDECPNHSKEWT